MITAALESHFYWIAIPPIVWNPTFTPMRVHAAVQYVRCDFIKASR